ncbi:MAG TPA: hypothetical protein VGM63_01930, partial [Mucilaginibacter sp.]|jgi:hypothetical protein
MKRQPPKGAIQEALKHPSGWVYEIGEAFKGKDEVPSEGVKGAWKVDEKGIIVGEFIPNPVLSRGCASSPISCSLQLPVEKNQAKPARNKERRHSRTFWSLTIK